MTTAFVLSGGASLGAVQVGMMQALTKHGIRPDLLVGTSVGAINAAWGAGHPEPERLEELASIWRGLRREQIFPLRPLDGVLGLLGRRDHLISPAGLRELLEKHLSFGRLEDARLPLHVVATDAVSGQGVVLSRGPAIPALMASSAIPGVFPAVRIGGRDLIDGGVAAHTPIPQAVELGATTLYVLHAGYACALREAPGSVLGMALHVITLVMQQRLLADLDRLRHDVRLHVVPPLCPLEVSPAEFTRAAELIDRARASTLRWLSNSHRRPPHPAALSPHSHR